MTRRVPPTVLTVLLLARVALATEEAHAHHEAGIPWATLAFSTINLLIFVWVLRRFAWPAVHTWVHERRERVVAALEDAATAKAEAEKLRAEWDARLAALNDEIEQMRTQARHDAERERERILAAAQKTADGIRRDAERAAAYEVRRTQQQLRAELVRQAVALAEQQARAQLTPADQQRFIADFLAQVGA